MFGHVLKNILMQFPNLGSPGIQRLSIATCWINICINHKPMRPKILSNWLADFQNIWVTCTPYFQEIWQLLCCWSEYVWSYLAKFLWRSELQISQLSVLKHSCGVAFLSAPLCGEPFVTLLHPFVEASVSMVIWSSCSWNFVFGEQHISIHQRSYFLAKSPRIMKSF